MQKGDVFFYQDFTFINGDINDKWFVVLNDAKRDGQALALKTTSKADRYLGSVQGCNTNPAVFFAPCSWQTCFTLDTYIQIPVIFPFHLPELERLERINRVQARGCLIHPALPQLLSCLAAHKEDIAPRHWKLIYT